MAGNALVLKGLRALPVFLILAVLLLAITTTIALTKRKEEGWKQAWLPLFWTTVSFPLWCPLTLLVLTHVREYFEARMPRGYR